jgi:outer membrane lipoprotein-sorting protein
MGYHSPCGIAVAAREGCKRMIFGFKTDNFLISRHRLPLLALVLIALSTLIVSEGVQAAFTTRAYIGEINLKNKMTDGKNMLNSLAASADAVQDYSCDCTLVHFKGKKPTEMTGRFYYLKPGQVRLEVVSKDYRNGSVVVRGSNNKIRGVGGGMLKSLKMNLEEDSRMLKLPNGYCVVKTDFPSLYADVRKSIANGSQCRTLSDPTEVNTAHGTQKLLVFEVFDRSDSGEVMKHRVLIDPNTKLPVEWGVFQNGNLITTNYFLNLAVNQGLPADKFKI